MYQITYANQLKKDFKRVDKQAMLALKTKHLPVIVNDPYGVGERLIILVQFGTRENFYKELKRRTR